MKIDAVTNDIILITTDTQAELANIFIRFQEYYESPLPEIKGKVFTLGMLRAAYSRDSRRSKSGGGFTYIPGNFFEGDWNGFNIPSYALDPFIKGLFDPLTPQEQDMITLFGCREGSFYIIGVHEEKGTDYALNHEIAHGLFYTVPAYRRAVEKILNEHELSDFQQLVVGMGYADDPYILTDETHAYLGVDFEWMKKNKSDLLSKCEICTENLQSCSSRLVELFNQHYTANKIEAAE
jgi:hypothetical protein